MHRGLCYVESKFKKHLFYFFTFKEQPCWLNIPLGFFYLFTLLPFYLYKVQLVTPSVVAMAVRTEIAICKIVFQVFAFIV